MRNKFDILDAFDNDLSGFDDHVVYMIYEYFKILNLRHKDKKFDPQYT